MEASPWVHRGAVAGAFVDSGPGVFLDEPAAGTLVGERGCDGQAGDKEQGEDGEFGLHGGVVHKPFRRGPRNLSPKNDLFSFYPQICADFRRLF